VSTEKPSKIIHALAEDIRRLLSESNALQDPGKRGNAKEKVDTITEILALRELGA